MKLLGYAALVLVLSTIVASAAFAAQAQAPRKEGRPGPSAERHGREVSATAGGRLRKGQLSKHGMPHGPSGGFQEQRPAGGGKTISGINGTEMGAQHNSNIDGTGMGAQRNASINGTGLNTRR